MMVKENILLFCCSSNRMQAIRAPDYIRLATMETNGRFLGETTRSLGRKRLTSKLILVITATITTKKASFSSASRNFYRPCNDSPSYLLFSPQQEKCRRLFLAEIQ
jgi:hypothetical protein